ncbi:sensor domain-containing diguanylate cyclase [Chromobacterium phragmitis]|uniref:Sensor domain-containing diguanylate cyclase n=1 Tax=Chromobacterium phragmitis TaxID=2202141 RepID=A0A344UJ32_9NEIS|nr:sensor domain-containing diguanylate cyclase [Chromobacterium phragmitis]AXE29890.1 sensor domain-containing diguanylate cyclase [Chromobacterium phragmitis]AXE35280.1 sensor domain-containing diguanylate cyclase [Chromobacterium phragmitis]
MHARLVYAGCLVLWLILSALAALSIASRSLLGAEQQFNSQLQQLTEQLKQRLLTNETILDSYATFSSVDHRGDGRQNHPFVSQLLRRYPQITSLARVERVPAGQAATYSHALQLDYGLAYRLRGFDEKRPLPKQEAYFPLTRAEPPSQANLRLVGRDIWQQPQLREALQENINSGRTALSRQLRLPPQGDPGYALLRSVDDHQNDQLIGLLPQHFAMLFIRADSLLPTDIALPPGMEINLRHRDDPLQPQSGISLRLGDAHPGALEKLLFPRLETSQLLGGASQPLRLTLSWQQGWAQIGWFEWAVWLSLSLLLGLGLGLAGFSFVRSSDNRRQREQQLFHLANHDRLTGLANRNLFYDRLQHAITRLDRSGKRLGLLFLDLDRFKPVNDTYGHVVGDRVLQLIAARIRDVVRNEDTVARIGGDEFVILMEDIESNREADKVAARLKQAIQMPYQVDHHRVLVGVSIGIAYYPEDGLLIDELLAVADRKMYGNKQSPSRQSENVG